MHRSTMTFYLSAAEPGKGNFHLTLMLTKWDGHKQLSRDAVLDTRLYNVREYDDTDPLVWAEHLLDEMYKKVNEMRARRLDTGWISGSGGTGSGASENVSPGV